MRGRGWSVCAGLGACSAPELECVADPSTSGSSPTQSSTTTTGTGGAGGATSSTTTTSATGGGGQGGDGGQGGTDCDIDGDTHLSWKCGGDDCADEDGRAYLNAPDYQTTAIMGETDPMKGGSFDFDCNGLQEPQYAFYACSGVCVQKADVFLGSVPVNCGDTGLFGTCTAVTCNPMGANEKQPCK